MKLSLMWVSGFITLSLYVNGIPPFLSPDKVALWAAYWGGFFILLLLVSRVLLNEKSVSNFGLQRRDGWLVNFLLGFVIAFLIFALKYSLLYGFRKFDIVGFMPGAYISQILITGAIAMLFSSLLNDIVIRGYVYAAAKKFGFVNLFLVISVVLYVLDDSWNAGFDWVNVIFSTLLGLAFAYSVLKTGSIWMSFGLHWGGNFMYRLMYGFDGHGILKLQGQVEGFWYEVISLGVTALMFPVVYLVLTNRRFSSRQMTS